MANRYLEGNFAPVHEEVTAVDLAVTGTVPAFLDGRYLRNGPNPPGDPGERHHWFLGHGMVHGVRLRAGRAEWYRNRWVARPGSEDKGPNTNVIGHAGQTLALVESGPTPYELTFDLDSVGRCDFGGTLSFGEGAESTQGYTAHPHRDPVSGELHAVSYNWVRGTTVDYTVIGTDMTVVKHVEVQTHGMPMIHDCAITENHLVIYDLPVSFDFGMVTTGHPRQNPNTPEWVIDRVARGEPVNDPTAPLPYSWDPDYPARLGLVPRAGDGSDVRWFEVDQCYVFHTLNAYETGTGEVVVEAVRHPRMFATDFTGPNEGDTSLVRFTLDLSSGKVREDRMDEHPQEFPRYDERRTGQRHRYGYTVGMVGPAFGDQIRKHDVSTGTVETRSLGGGREAAEFCFVPDPDSDVEDAGVLMGFVFDPPAGRSELRILDAGSLEDVASVVLPGRVPTGFHGNWVDV